MHCDAWARVCSTYDCMLYLHCGQEYMSKKAVAEAKVMESIEQASKAQALAQEARGKMAAQKRTVDSS
eukprot:193664-Pelagomonas_calceolata.AAC.4